MAVHLELTKMTRNSEERKQAKSSKHNSFTERNSKKGKVALRYCSANADRIFAKRVAKFLRRA